jgi:hypothetical protein
VNPTLSIASPARPLQARHTSRAWQRDASGSAEHIACEQHVQQQQQQQQQQRRRRQQEQQQLGDVWPCA